MISVEAKMVTLTSNHGVKDTKYNLIQHRKTMDSFITYQRSLQRDNKTKRPKQVLWGQSLKRGEKEEKENKDIE